MSTVDAVIARKKFRELRDIIDSSLSLVIARVQFPTKDGRGRGVRIRVRPAARYKCVRWEWNLIERWVPRVAGKNYDPPSFGVCEKELRSAHLEARKRTPGYL